MLPNFAIIGAQKCGSTFIHHCLMEHPEVFMPPGEIPFFEDPDYHQKDIQQFENLFEDGWDKKLVGFKRSNYLTKSECPRRIHRHMPDIKLIVILRDPIERLVSAYYHIMRQGYIPIRHINDGLVDIINGKYSENYPKAKELIEYGFYYRYLSQYLKFFDRDKIMILLLDDVKRNTFDAIKTIFEFLEISPDYRPQSLTSRPKSGIYSIPRQKFLRLQNPFKYEYSSDKMRLFMRDDGGRLYKFIVRFLNFADRKILAQIFSNEKPNLDQPIMEQLSSIYEEDTQELARFLGRDLDNWRVLPNSNESNHPSDRIKIY